MAVSRSSPETDWMFTSIKSGLYTAIDWTAVSGKKGYSITADWVAATLVETGICFWSLLASSLLPNTFDFPTLAIPECPTTMCFRYNFIALVLVVTYCSLVQPKVWIRAQMRRQVLPYIPFTASWTCERLLPRVSTHVQVQYFMAHKRFLTQIALGELDANVPDRIPCICTACRCKNSVSLQQKVFWHPSQLNVFS